MDDVKLIGAELETKQYIVVDIGIEQFGIDIEYVDNIVRMQKITRVPRVQSYFKGVINLRGEIIPVMSIRDKFGLEADTITDKTRIIIIRPEQQDSIGFIVDAVKEVVTLDMGSVEKIQQEKQSESSRYISAIGKNQNTLISLLNINGVIGENSF